MNLSGKSNIIRTFLIEKDDSSALKLIDYAKFQKLNDSEIVELAQGLANSGESINNETDITYCDIPSTGGPSSLSTLICPLFLKILGGKVIKLGVPGRPAGGIDVLAQVKGYKANLTPSEIKEWAIGSQYVHFLSDDTFAPLDAKLFNLRKQNNAIDIPAFVIASILSKKIAVGLKNIGLDIRVSSFGNFGRTIVETRANAVRFNTIAKKVGIKSKCFITDGTIPQQPYIGRGESILALNRILNNRADAQLGKHLAICYSMACSLFDVKGEEISVSLLKEVFHQNLTIQGGDISSFNRLADTIEKENQYTIKSSNSGILSIDLFRIREAITRVQQQITGVEFPDPCGLILKAMPGQYIGIGTPICSFRCTNEYKSEFEIMLTGAFNVSNNTNQLNEFEIIS